MTAQSSVSFFDTSQAQTTRSFLRRLVHAIMESRRSKAEEIVAEYVRAHPELKCHLDPSSSVMRHGRSASKQRIVRE
jgi:hypothetical protein